MEVSIIIVNYNTKDLLRNCLNSIINTTSDLSYEIIVSDNNSKDGSVEMIKSEFPKVLLIENEINGGFAYGNNKGIKISSGDFIFLLNSDTIILNDAIFKMLQYMKENKKIGILGPKLLNPDLTDQTSVFAYPTIFKEFASIFEIKKLLNNKLFKKFIMKISIKFLSNDVNQYLNNFKAKREIETVEVLVGAAMLIRREVIEKIGGLDEDYFMYYEEIDYCLNSAKHGWPCVFYPEAEIIHLIGQSSKKLNSFTFITRYKSMLHYFEKNHGNGKKNIVKFILIIGLNFRRLKEVIFSILHIKNHSKQNTKIYKDTIKMVLSEKQ